MQYTIRIAGEVGTSTLASLGEFTAHVGGGETRLEGPIRDQPALFGVLGRIQALGLELIEVTPIGTVPSPDGMAGSALGGTEPPT